jgi:hypothetical protein
MANLGLRLSTMAAYLAAQGAGNAIAAPPPPPPAYFEFFNPTYRRHQIDAKCQAAQAAIAWSFDGERARIDRFSFARRQASRTQIERINGWLVGFKGDITVFLECGNDGAALTIKEVAPWMQEPLKVVRFEWRNGEPNRN